MSVSPDVWNALHDGSIVAISGAVPGMVQLDIAIDYLRARFPDPGQHMRLTLYGCTRLAYRDYDANEFVADLSAVAGRKPEILHAEMTDDCNRIECSGGVLEVMALDYQFTLENGKSVSLQEVFAALEAYWTEWSKGSQRNQP